MAGTDDGLFTCARIHQYPRGGGFMGPHRDLSARATTVEAELDYYQVILLLSERGQDYALGGGYIDIDDERVAFESETNAGDVVVYDGRTMHGVADIDPLAPLDLHRFTGRVAAFVSLYRQLAPGADDYARLSRNSLQRFGLESPDE